MMKGIRKGMLYESGCLKLKMTIQQVISIWDSRFLYWNVFFYALYLVER